MGDKPGIVYAVTNKAYPTWVKVGRAEGEQSDAENVMKRRLYSYNTGDPERGYEVLVSSYAACCVTAERYAHDFLDAFSFRGNGEWFQQREDDVKHFVEIAAQIARLHPALRSQRYSETLEDARNIDTSIEAVSAGPLVDRTSYVRETARAAHAVITDLLKMMAMPCEHTEAAAKAVLHRLDTLGNSA